PRPISTRAPSGVAIVWRVKGTGGAEAAFIASVDHAGAAAATRNPARKAKTKKGAAAGPFSTSSGAAALLETALLCGVGHVRQHRLGHLGARRLAALVEDEFVAMRGDATDLAHLPAGAGRDQTADDDVFLQALQHVDLAGDSRL